jgi:hypothetical protein
MCLQGIKAFGVDFGPSSLRSTQLQGIACGRGASRRRIFGCAMVANDVVFTSTYAGAVYALSVRDGSILWRAHMRANANSCRAFAGDRRSSALVYVERTGSRRSLSWLRSACADAAYSLRRGMGYSGQRRLIVLGALVAVAFATAHVAAGVSTATTRWIVFSATPAGERMAQLFRVETTGSGIEQITTGANIATQPAFSPDGKRVVFARLGTGIFVVNLDGGGLHRLTGGARDQFPVWSPDGKHIAFLRLVKNAWRIYLMSPSGGAQHRLGNAPPGGRPSWTADSKSIFIPVQGGLQKVDARTGRTQKQFALAALDLGTSNAATLSPNSKKVAFVAPRPSTPDCGEVSCAVYALYLADVPGGKTRRFANNTSPAGWSPDSSTLVFVYRGELAVWPVASKTPTSTIATGDHVAAGDAPPAWQPR